MNPAEAIRITDLDAPQLTPMIAGAIAGARRS
jgi:hypothetical protein